MRRGSARARAAAVRWAGAVGRWTGGRAIASLGAARRRSWATGAGAAPRVVSMDGALMVPRRCCDYGTVGGGCWGFYILWLQ